MMLSDEQIQTWKDNACPKSWNWIRSGNVKNQPFSVWGTVLGYLLCCPCWVAILGGRRLYKGTGRSLTNASSCTQWEQNSRFSQELGWGQVDKSQICFPGTGSWVLTCDVGHERPGVTGTCSKAPYRSLRCVCALRDAQAASGVWASCLFLAVCRGQANTSHSYNASLSSGSQIQSWFAVPILLFSCMFLGVQSPFS